MVELFGNQVGSGQPLLVLHGLFGSADNWRSHAKALSEHFCVYTLDLRNHGRSPHNDEMRYADMAADLVHFMDSHGIDSAHVLGHSMGGKAAMQLALSHPDRVRRLIVVDIAPVSYPDRHQAVFDGLLAVKPGEIDSRREADQRLAAYVDELPVRQFLLTNLVRSSAGGYQWRIGLDEIQRNYEHIRAAPTGEAFAGPTLFIRGERSDYIAPQHEQRIVELFPQARIQSIAAGHWVHAEQPQQFLQQVLVFLTA